LNKKREVNMAIASSFIMTPGSTPGPSPVGKKDYILIH